LGDAGRALAPVAADDEDDLQQELDALLGLDACAPAAPVLMSEMKTAPLAPDELQQLFATEGMRARDVHVEARVPLLFSE
jgi:hypothetical protein